MCGSYKTGRRSTAGRRRRAGAAPALRSRRSECPAAAVAEAEPAVGSMADAGRLNNIIRAWEQGRPAFAAFAHADQQTAIESSAAPYDGIIFEMEHNPFDVQGLQDSLQYLLDRKQIFTAGSLAPAVTPIVRVPDNGGE